LHRYFAGSNVGKSSVINVIANQKISFTSKKPGKTSTANFFKTKNATSFVVDLPGYGFAKRSEEMRDLWANKLHNFLSRRQVEMVYLLIDAVVGVTELDKRCMEYIKHIGKPFSIVINKIDKLSKKELGEAEKTKFALKDDADSVYFISTKANGGDIAKLHRDVEDILFGSDRKRK
jgi:GTP-binding protein